MGKNLEQIEKTGKKQTAASKAKPKSPKKPATSKSRTRGLGTWRQRARQQRYDDDDDDDLDLLGSDSEMYESSSQSAPSCSARSNYQPHDPNTIVLDCDDVFDGVPAVSYTRNFATASAVSAEESMELKVNVRINGKIEHFYMNPVCIFGNSNFRQKIVLNCFYLLSSKRCPRWQHKSVRNYRYHRTTLH